MDEWGKKKNGQAYKKKPKTHSGQTNEQSGMNSSRTKKQLKKPNTNIIKSNDVPIDKDLSELKDAIISIKNSIEYNKNKITKLTGLTKILKICQKNLANKEVNDVDSKNYENRYIDNMDLVKSKIKQLEKEISIEKMELEACENVYSLRMK